MVMHVPETPEQQESSRQGNELTYFLGNAAKVALVTGATAAAVVGVWHLVRHARYGDEIKAAEAVRDKWHEYADKFSTMSKKGQYHFHQEVFNPAYAQFESMDMASIFPNFPEDMRYSIGTELKYFTEEGLKGIGDRKFANRMADIPKLSPWLVGGISAAVGAISIPFVTKDKEKPSTIITSSEPQERAFGELPTKEKSALPVHDAVIMAG